MIAIATLVRVKHEMFMNALGIVLEQNGPEVLVRLDNGTLLAAIETDVEVVKFMPGSDTAYAFLEDVVVTARVVNWYCKLATRTIDQTDQSTSVTDGNPLALIRLINRWTHKRRAM